MIFQLKPLFITSIWLKNHLNGLNQMMGHGPRQVELHNPFRFEHDIFIFVLTIGVLACYAKLPSGNKSLKGPYFKEVCIFFSNEQQDFLSLWGKFRHVVGWRCKPQGTHLHKLVLIFQELF